MCEIFSIDDFMQRWNVSTTKWWFDQLKKASDQDLIDFKKSVKRRRKDLLKNQVFANSSKFTLYHMLIFAIDHELMKRSKLKMKIFYFLLPIREELVWFIGHRKLHYQWELFVWYEYIDTKNLLYKPLGYYSCILRNFWLKHWKWIIGSIIAVLSIYLNWKSKGN